MNFFLLNIEKNNFIIGYYDILIYNGSIIFVIKFEVICTNWTINTTIHSNKIERRLLLFSSISMCTFTIFFCHFLISIIVWYADITLLFRNFILPTFICSSTYVMTYSCIQKCIFFLGQNFEVWNILMYSYSTGSLMNAQKFFEYLLPYTVKFVFLWI